MNCALRSSTNKIDCWCCHVNTAGVCPTCVKHTISAGSGQVTQCRRGKDEIQRLMTDSMRERDKVVREQAARKKHQSLMHKLREELDTITAETHNGCYYIAGYESKIQAIGQKLSMAGRQFTSSQPRHGDMEYAAAISRSLSSVRSALIVNAFRALHVGPGEQVRCVLEDELYSLVCRNVEPQQAVQLTCDVSMGSRLSDTVSCSSSQMQRGVLHRSPSSFVAPVLPSMAGVKFVHQQSTSSSCTDFPQRSQSTNITYEHSRDVEASNLGLSQHSASYFTSFELERVFILLEFCAQVLGIGNLPFQSTAKVLPANGTLRANHQKKHARHSALTECVLSHSWLSYTGSQLSDSGTQKVAAKLVMNARYLLAHFPSIQIQHVIPCQKQSFGCSENRGLCVEEDILPGTRHQSHDEALNEALGAIRWLAIIDMIDQVTMIEKSLCTQFSFKHEAMPNVMGWELNSQDIHHFTPTINYKTSSSDEWDVVESPRYPPTPSQSDDIDLWEVLVLADQLCEE